MVNGHPEAVAIARLSFTVEPPDHTGKSMVFARWDGAQVHAARFDPFIAPHCGEFCDSLWNRIESLRTALWHPDQEPDLSPIGDMIRAAATVGDSIAIEYPAITCQQLATTDYSEEFLIDDCLVARQPCCIGGPRKGLKTLILIDGSISIATGTPFLGKFKVLNSGRVGVMSGESGMSTIQKKARAIAGAKGFDLENIDGIVWSDKLPRFGSIRHIDGLNKWLTENELSVLFVDPCYLCMPVEGREGSIFAMGDLLRSISEPCQERGVTLVIAHHLTKEASKSHDPPELDWLSWSGFAEFSRQWWLINRRVKYEPGTHRHNLWLSIGGSACHGALWAANVYEGSRHDPKWEVELLHPDELNQQQHDAVEAERDAKLQERIDRDKLAIIRAVRKLPDHQGTPTQIRARSGRNSQSFNLAFAELVDAGDLLPVDITKANRRTYEGFKLREESE
jgi:AAA domain